MRNSADPDQLSSSEAKWSGSTLFAKAGHNRVQQDKGQKVICQGKRILKGVKIWFQTDTKVNLLLFSADTIYMCTMF